MNLKILITSKVNLMSLMLLLSTLLLTAECDILNSKVPLALNHMILDTCLQNIAGKVGSIVN